ncbi:hypothetical protein EKO27_g7387 [Xylaria grammica]|uniref:Uncharacterized protein n=1 Tax=Xylaria grammica TaxID=363999 RepID=A0A439CZU9_9PEZI|nr:hypothetical protein EKO27_g7387 [Xylaria grammica]
MSSIGDSHGSFSDAGNDDGPTHNPPWPYVNPFLQGRFERKYIADGGTVDFGNLPKQQFWASWFGLSDVAHVLQVLKKIEAHSLGVHRQVTGTEANAIAEHASNSLQYLNWVKPISCAISLALTVSRRHTFSFPFYKPKMIKFDPFSFPTKKLRLLKGFPASVMWHTVRFGAYLPFAFFPTVIIYNSMSEQSYIAHTKRDPRLSALIQESIEKYEEHLRRQGRIPNRPGIPAPQNPQRTGDEAYGGDQRPQEYGSASYATQSSDAFERSGAATEASRTTRPLPRRVQENAPRDFGSRHLEDDSDLFDDDDDDDASPVARSARGQDVRRGQSGSSWDRIRQQAKSDNPDWKTGDSSGQEQGWGKLRQDKAPNSRDSTPKTDSYSYSADDEERERRNYEKEQAQKEFDNLLEAERRGDNNRGWRR